MYNPSLELYIIDTFQIYNPTIIDGPFPSIYNFPRIIDSIQHVRIYNPSTLWMGSLLHINNNPPNYRLHLMYNCRNIMDGLSP